MSEVISPDAFNEAFTVYEEDGKLVKLILRDMTAEDVAHAIDWAVGESEYLEHLAKPAALMAEAAAQGRMGEVAHVTKEEIIAAGLSLRRAGEAHRRYSRLAQMVLAMMPQAGEEASLGDALRKWWPGRRAA